MTDTITDRIFAAAVADKDRDGGLGKQAHEAEPANFVRHVVALSCSKIADGLISPKLVLSWLLTSLGAGAFWAGLLVPVRESLALLPQLLTAPAIAAQPVRKWFWVGGAAIQGVCAAGIGLAALTLQGNLAGAIIVGLLACLALARSVCSASYKDILGKSVGKSRRGTASGFASTAASIGVILFALILMTGIGDRGNIVVGAIFLAAVAWVCGAAVLSNLREVPSRNTARPETGAQFKLLRDRPQLTRFILCRSLLVGTALAPPYLVLLQGGGALGVLGAMVLASALASLASSFIWGRLSDRSSRRVLIYAGLSGGIVLAMIAGLDLIGMTGTPFVVPGLLFGLMIAYEGVRQGRSTHLVDMAGESDRASFAALSNTLVGLVLIGFGAAAAALSAVSIPLVIALFAVMCLGGAALALGLDEVQQ